ncbi:hypothetical protein [Streptomyces sp. NPDC057939]|uniref:hypothetical protein n=1 Tax=Streptomyces sp. NPDC057939 TaxID=3346284 RepID=UPI0036F12DE7
MNTELADLTDRTAVAWRQLSEWLRAHAPTSYASILPAASPEEIEEAQERLRRCCGFGLPSELVALWGLAAGVQQVDIDEHDEEGEVATGRFLPHGVLLTPAQSIRPRLTGLDPRGKDYWEGAQWAAAVGNYSDAADAGLYLSTGGLGRWRSYEGLFTEEPLYPSIAAYLESVNRALTEGLSGWRGTHVPGIVYGCLIWEDPLHPRLDEARPDWRPVH